MPTRSAAVPVGWRRLASWAPSPVVLLFAVAVAVASYLFLPLGGLDWRNDIAPGARHLWPAPWTEGLPLLPWAALILAPLAALPDRLATALLNAGSVVALALVIRSFGGRDWMAIPLLASPFGFWLFSNGQTDTIILAGLLLPKGADLLILALKPQVAFGVVVARLRQSGKHWPRYLAPLAVMLALSLAVWPDWPLALVGFAPVLIPASWNWSIWPWGLPVAAWLLWRAWQSQDDRFAVAATPFLFPYVNPPSYLGLLAVLAVRWPRWVVAGWLAVLAVFGGYVVVFLAGR